jgi:hypothetical protein
VQSIDCLPWSDNRSPFNNLVSMAELLGPAGVRHMHCRVKPQNFWSTGRKIGIRVLR